MILVVFHGKMTIHLANDRTKLFMVASDENAASSTIMGLHQILYSAEMVEASNVAQEVGRKKNYWRPSVLNANFGEL
jgi:hypothetical protein